MSSKEVYVIFMLKYVNILRITPVMAKNSRIRRLEMVIIFKRNMNIRPIIFWGAVLSRHTETIDPTDKPIILGY